MAPTAAKGRFSKDKAGKPTKSSSGGSTSRVKKRQPRTKGPAQVKSKPSAPNVVKKKKRIYNEQELGIPKLNMITPAGVQKPKGKKKGKVFVDDQESMMTILAMVNADKEGQIESKMIKARQLEEIREARTREAEARSADKRAILEDTKDALRKRRKRKVDLPAETEDDTAPTQRFQKSRKRVSFG